MTTIHQQILFVIKQRLYRRIVHIINQVNGYFQMNVLTVTSKTSHSISMASECPLFNGIQTYLYSNFRWIFHVYGVRFFLA